MLAALAESFFGSANSRYLKRLEKKVTQINALESELSALSDDVLRSRTEKLRTRHKSGETLDELLCEAFAVVREAAKRTLGQRHFDVQVLGGMVLHEGAIAEMKTGEGKTLVATLPVYLNALSGQGVHVVTVNDYLAQRDARWMGQVYEFLGLTVGCIIHGLDDLERQQAYAADVTYGTNNEFGFDYLRDNMKFRLEDMAQREFNFAIVDEVDSILIDEARTPLIISGPTEDSSEMYRRLDELIPHLAEEHYEKDEKQRTVALTESGVVKIEELLAKTDLMNGPSLYDINNIAVVHHVNQALKAHTMFQIDTDYIVKDNQVIIIDEFTGRMMEGRRYSEGLHQALEAKEHVEVQNENQTLASITFQNYFRLYPKLAGMTGTAMTEEGEFADIYGLDVVEIPTHKPCVREDLHDEVYRTATEKNEAIIALIEECIARNQPALVGTISIEKSEQLAAILKERKIAHNVLNARYHEQEAFIVAQAGKPGQVTISTNMAGRGTDIQLGGNIEMQVLEELSQIKGEKKRNAQEPEIRTRVEAEIEAAREIVLDAGGLYIICTERHESRRIDNQLRGRSGRQGDPGASKFFLSLEDDLMRIFGSERIDTMLQKLGLEEGEAIVHPWINKALEKAQRKVEERNFEIRKTLLQFDDVMNDQRKVIYEQRRELMEVADVSNTVTDMRLEVIDNIVSKCIPEKAYAEQWDTDALHEEILRIVGLDLPVADWAKEEGIANEEISERLTDAVNRRMAEKVANYGAEMMRIAEKSVLLQVLDQIWKEHLLALDHLRQGIGLRAYAQKDPLNEYKHEAFDLFDQMLAMLRETVTQVLCHMEISEEDPDGLMDYEMGDIEESRNDPAFSDDLGMAAIPDSIHPAAQAQSIQESPTVFLAGTDPADIPMGWRFHEPLGRWIDPEDPETWGKVPRNAACPCGSGKKFKVCHGRVT
ncbi:MAG: preprotein translocase subunit SecA [Rhodospirillaceae bacterium]|nr:preprotein translocase subunit SecA [Rhodospirillaceae bacterium]